MTATCDVERTIDLFDQNHAHHTVSEGHFGDGKAKIRDFFDALVHAKRTADDECDLGISRKGDI